jgi:hypothetical protein
MSTADKTATIVAFHILANSLFADHFFVPPCFIQIVGRVRNSVLLLLLLLLMMMMMIVMMIIS